MEQDQLPVDREAEAPAYSVPWSVMDTWLGVGLLALLSLGMLIILFLGIGRQQYMQNASVLLLELIYLLPILLIFGWRRISWKYLGFGKFSINVIGIGCGLLVGAYVLIFLHNTVLNLLGIDTQGDQILEMFNQLESPVWFFLVAAVIAPIVEELFFRGFLFQGLRQAYGWLPGLLLSSAIFGVAHLDPVSLVPTFVLGCVLAYLYHRSNSVWPGIVFHATINSLSLIAVYVISQNPSLFPS
ncbi:MAG TPA: type II CAAX endopeptidase family protein [Anaerolineales bacterium]|nr:type II CAAX endopeptidase family protein [Anaerolineales bacterium]